MREAWASASQARLRDADVLDLFSGTGAVGLEALSRGAQRISFVERRGASLKALQKNIQALNAGGRTTVWKMDVFKFLRREPRARFDLCYADPPYGAGLADRLARIFAQTPFARELWIEHSRRELLSVTPKEARAYGDTELSMLKG